jgi:hypothetical protein
LHQVVRRSLAVLCIGWVALVVGCASTATTPTGTTAGATSAAETDQAAPIAPPEPDYGAEAERAVKSYYRAVDAQNFEKAWRRLGPAVRTTFGGYAKWTAGFENSVLSRVTSASALDASRSSAEVAVALTSKDIDVCGSDVVQRFRGVWKLSRTDGRWIAEHIVMRKVAGRTPVSAADECPGGSLDDTGDPCDPTSSAYDEITCDDESGGNDSGDPCDPNSTAYDDAACYGDGGDEGSFCESHDCIDSFDEGTGYIVQCNDGMWSHSGGRPGACSYHDGESDVTAP